MADNQDSDFSDTDFISNLLNCDADQLRAIDNGVVQKEADRISATVSEKGNNFCCRKCNSKFSRADSLKRHIKEERCSKKSFICQNCGKTYSKQGCLNKHTERGKCIRPRQSDKTSGDSRNLSCSTCGTRFSNTGNLNRHLKRNNCGSVKHQSVFECASCGKKFRSASTLKLHSKTHQQQDQFPSGNVDNDVSGVPGEDIETDDGNGGGDGGGDDDGDDNGSDDDDGDDDVDDEGRVQSRRTLFNDTLVRYTLRAQRAEQLDVMYFFSNRRNQLRNNIIRELGRFKHLKWYTMLKVDMIKLNSEGEQVDEAKPVFRSFTRQVLDPNSIDSQIDEAYFKMLNSLDTFKSEGSGWMIRKVLYMEQTIAKYSPLGGSCYNFRVPETLLRKRCLLNVTGPPELDGHCFKYSVLAALFTNEQVIGQIPWSDLHQYRDRLNFDSVPNSGRCMPVTSIPEFELSNGLSINIYGHEENEVFPVYITNQFKRQRHVNLLLLCPQTDDDNESDVINLQTIADNRRAHYCVIKNINALVLSQATQRRAPVFVCMRCLTVKHTADSLTEHEELCFKEEEEPVRCIMPGQEEKWLKFRNIGKRMKVSFVIVACFSCYTVPLLTNDIETHGYEVRERRLDPCAYSYMRISIDGSYPKAPVYYRGSSPEDTMDHFLAAMASEEQEIFSILSQTAPVVWCDEGLANIEASNTECVHCHDVFLPGDKVCLDHSHVSGKIRGRSCNSCNLRVREKNFLPVFVQSLTQFEGRLILQAVNRYGAKTVSVVPQTLDSYVSLTISKQRYLDFRRFLKAPLNDLVEVLREKSGVLAFNFTQQNVPEQHLDTVIRRQVFCSDYIDSEERLREQSLPPMESFYDRINDIHVSQGEYDHAKQLWSLYEMETLDDYLRHYLTVQSLLFADVFENFRDVMMKDYGLDVAQYYSLPGFCWDACLYKSEVTLELLTDEQMHEVILNAIRGGSTVVGTPRMVRANNPQMPKELYDPTRPDSYLLFTDFNSLYPSVMLERALPTYGFKWMSQFEIERLDIMNIPDDSDTGYILVVDMEIPEDKHDHYDQYPMMPENMIIGEEHVSEYTKQLASACNVNVRPTKKLCLSLNNKTKYAVHYATLKCYIRHGLVVKHVHKAISFRQSTWLHDFMTFTTQKRIQANNQFDKMLYKSVACNVFGKSIENVKQRISVKIVRTATELRRLVNKPTFQAIRVFDSNLAAVQLYRQNVKLNKPIAVGFSVLEMSKEKMYDFWYETLLGGFSDFRVRLIMSDTDSFLVHIEKHPETQTAIESVLLQHQDKFDFSSLNGPLKNVKNKEVPGKMKIQLPNEVCMEAVVLSSKCYSILTDRGSHSAMKGVPGKLRHEMYKDCIINEKCYVGRINSIKHFNQTLYHVSTERRMLSPIDMKRFYLSANESLSYGHYRLQNAQFNN